MIDQLLVVSAILQWIVIFCGVALMLALLRVIGSISANQHDAQHSLDEVSLKGVNIGALTVHDVRGEREVLVQELLDNQPALLIVTDPACEVCDRRIRDLQQAREFPWGQTIVAVRGQHASAVQVARELPVESKVIVDDVHLGLRAFKPPFVTVLDNTGTYAGFLSLNNDGDVRRVSHMIENEQARERMAANYSRLEEVGMVSSEP